MQFVFIKNEIEKIIILLYKMFKRRQLNKNIMKTKMITKKRKN